MRSTTPADKVIITLALILLGGLYHYYWLKPSGAADYAIISVAQQPPQRIQLQQAQTIAVEGQLGTTWIEVAPGQIRFLKAPCPGQYCVHAGWLKHSGDFVTCLPNRVSIELISQTEQSFDSIAY